MIRAVRLVHWLLVVSMLLFVGGIVLIVRAAQTARREPPPQAAAAALVPVASVRQIMDGIVSPAADAVFNAVSSEVTAAGVTEKFPKTDAEWRTVGDSAAALVESGNLMLMGSRAIDTGDWTAITREMIKVSTEVLRATEAKDKDKVFDLGEGLYNTCDNCHRKYQRAS
jgi:hypothetical protein